MKIRHGFVSNSSTSSFVVAGFRIGKGDDLDKFKKYAKDNNIEFDDEDFDFYELLEKIHDEIWVWEDYENNLYVVGECITEGDDFLEFTHTDLQDIGCSEALQKVMEITGYDPPAIEIITGTRDC